MHAAVRARAGVSESVGFRFARRPSTTPAHAWLLGVAWSFRRMRAVYPVPASRSCGTYSPRGPQRARVRTLTVVALRAGTKTHAGRGRVVCICIWNRREPFGFVDAALLPPAYRMSVCFDRHAQQRFRLGVRAVISTRHCNSISIKKKKYVVHVTKRFWSSYCAAPAAPIAPPLVTRDE